MPITLNFSPKFWLNPPGSKMPAGLVHVVHRSPGTLSASQVRTPFIVPAWKSGSGVIKAFRPDKDKPTSIVKENVIGWCKRDVAIDAAFLFWSFLRFHEEHGFGPIPKGNAPDGYWTGLTIYSWMENDWKTWRAMDFTPTSTSFHTHDGVKLWP